MILDKITKSYLRENCVLTAKFLLLHILKRICKVGKFKFCLTLIDHHVPDTYKFESVTYV